MKLCKDCKHFSGSNFCNAPQNGISPIDGKPKAKRASAARAQEEFGCGLAAHYFEQKQNQSKPWWRFWS